MFYYIHKIYGYMSCSEPPLRNIENYQEITEEEYIIHEEMMRSLEEHKENKI